MSFIEDLWKSVFTPGTSPALMKATHASFIALFLALLFLIYQSRSIHYVNLLVIAIALYLLVLWFVKELELAKLKTNEELAEESKQDEKKPKSEEKTPSTQAEKTADRQTERSVRKRKV